jgi:hypothetical protein
MLVGSGRIVPRECEAVFRPINVIASEAKQSSHLLCGAMDCFASLAMTAETDAGLFDS